MKGPLCDHHRYKCHAGAQLFLPSYTIQINLHNSLPPWQLYFLSGTKTQLALLLSSLFLFSSFWEVRRGHIVWLAPSKRTSSTIPVSSHLACNQDGMWEGREGFFWISPCPDSSSRGKCYSRLHRNWYIPGICPRWPKVLGLLIPEQMPQLRTRWRSSMTRLLSGSRDLILLPFLSQTRRAIVLYSPICSLLSASKGWRTVKAACWGR